MTTKLIDAEQKQEILQTNSPHDHKTDVTFTSPLLEQIKKEANEHPKLKTGTERAAYIRETYNQSVGINSWITLGPLSKFTFDTRSFRLNQNECQLLLDYCQFATKIAVTKPENMTQELKRQENEWNNIKLNSIKEKIDNQLQSTNWHQINNTNNINQKQKYSFFAKLNSRSPKDIMTYLSKDNDIQLKFKKKLQKYLLTAEHCGIDGNYQFNDYFYHDATRAYFELVGDILKCETSDDVIRLFGQSYRIREDLLKILRLNSVYFDNNENDDGNDDDKDKDKDNDNKEKDNYNDDDNINININSDNSNDSGNKKGFRINGLPLILRQYNENVSKQPFGEFRCFVCNHRLTAISQYMSTMYFQKEIVDRKEEIKRKICKFYQDCVKPFITTQDSYVMDVFVDWSNNGNNGNNGSSGSGSDAVVADNIDNDGVYLIELNPFWAQTGGSMFSWKNDRSILLGSYYQEKGTIIKVRETTIPEQQSFTNFAKPWQKVVLQCRKEFDPNFVDDSQTVNDNNSGLCGCILL